MTYQQYYTNQVGGGQSIYTGRRYQRGHGLGNLLGSLFRIVAPMLRKSAISLGKDVRCQCRFMSSEKHPGWCTGKNLSNDTLLRKVDN